MSAGEAKQERYFSRNQSIFLAVFLSLIMIITAGLYAYAFTNFIDKSIFEDMAAVGEFEEEPFLDDTAPLTNDEITVKTEPLINAEANSRVKIPIKIKNTTKKSLTIDEIDISAIDLEKKIIFLDSDPRYLDINLTPDPKESEIWLLTDIKIRPGEQRTIKIGVKPFKKGVYVFTLGAWSADPETYYNYGYSTVVVE